MRARLAALIAEARRRALRRRLASAATALLALGIGAAVWGGLTLAAGDPRAGATVPPGFVLVPAQGPVVHAVITWDNSTQNGLRWDADHWVSTSLATGQDRPVRLTEETWYDAEGGLWRSVVRVDGRVRSDRSGTVCDGKSGSECRRILMPAPWAYLAGFPWPPEQAGSVPRDGTFEGRDVVWLTPR